MPPVAAADPVADLLAANPPSPTVGSGDPVADLLAQNPGAAPSAAVFTPERQKNEAAARAAVDELRAEQASELLTSLKKSAAAWERGGMPAEKIRQRVDDRLLDVVLAGPEGTEARQEFVEEARKIAEVSPSVGTTVKHGFFGALEALDSAIWRPMRSIPAGARDALTAELAGTSRGLLTEYRDAYLRNQQGAVAVEPEEDAFAAQLRAILLNEPLPHPVVDGGDPSPNLRAARNVLETAFLAGHLTAAKLFPQKAAENLLTPQEVKVLFDVASDATAAPLAEGATRAGYALLPGNFTASGVDLNKVASDEAVAAGSVGGRQSLDLVVSVVADPFSWLKPAAVVKKFGVGLSRKGAPLVERAIGEAAQAAEDAVRADVLAPATAAQERAARAGEALQRAQTAVEDLDATGPVEMTREQFLALRRVAGQRVGEAEAVAVREAEDAQRLAKLAEQPEALVQEVRAGAVTEFGDALLGATNFAFRRGLDLRGVGPVRVWKKLTRELQMTVPEFGRDLERAMRDAEAAGEILADVAPGPRGRLVFTFEPPALTREVVEVVSPGVGVGTSTLRAAANVSSDVRLTHLFDAGAFRVGIATYNAISSRLPQQGLAAIEWLRQAVLDVASTRRPQALAGYTTERLYRVFRQDELLHPAEFARAEAVLKRKAAMDELLGHRTPYIISKIKHVVPDAEARAGVIRLMDLHGMDLRSIAAVEAVRALEAEFRAAVRGGRLGVATIEDARALVGVFDDASAEMQRAIGAALEDPSAAGMEAALIRIEVLKAGLRHDAVQTMRAAKMASAGEALGASSPTASRLRATRAVPSDDDLAAVMKELRGTLPAEDLLRVQGNAAASAEVLAAEFARAYDNAPAAAWLADAAEAVGRVGAAEATLAEVRAFRATRAIEEGASSVASARASSIVAEAEQALRAARIEAEAFLPGPARAAGVLDIPTAEHVLQGRQADAVRVAHEGQMLRALERLDPQTRAAVLKEARGKKTSQSRLAAALAEIPEADRGRIRAAVEFVNDLLASEARNLRRWGLLEGDPRAIDEVVAGIDVSRLLERYAPRLRGAERDLLDARPVVSPMSEPRKIAVHERTISAENDARLYAAARQNLIARGREVLGRKPRTIEEQIALERRIDEIPDPSPSDVWTEVAEMKGAMAARHEVPSLVDSDLTRLLKVFLADAGGSQSSAVFLDRLLERFPEGRALAEEFGIRGDVAAQALGFVRLGPVEGARIRGLEVPEWFAGASQQIQDMLGKRISENELVERLQALRVLPEGAADGFFRSSEERAAVRAALALAERKPVYLPATVADYIQRMYGAAPKTVDGTRSGGQMALAVFDQFHGWAKTVYTIARVPYGHSFLNLVGNLTSQAQVLAQSLSPKYLWMARQVMHATEAGEVLLAGRRVDVLDLRHEMLEDGSSAVAGSHAFVREQGLTTPSALGSSSAAAAFREGRGIALDGQQIAPGVDIDLLAPYVETMAEALIADRPSILTRLGGGLIGGASGATMAGPAGAILGAIAGAGGAKSKSVLAEALEATTDARALSLRVRGKSAFKKQSAVSAKERGEAVLFRGTGATAGFFQGQIAGQQLGAAIGHEGAGAMVGGALGALLGGLTIPGSLRLFSELNSSIEGMARRTMYLAARDAGKTRAEAVELANKALRDYADLSPIERNHLRRVTGFWTWSAGNIRLQTEWAVKNPDKINVVLKLVDGITSGVYDEEDLAQMSDSQAWRLSFLVHRGNYVRRVILPELPQGEIPRILEDGFWETAHQRINPVLSMVAAAVFGVDWTRGNAEIDQMVSARPLGVSVEDVGKLPMSLQGWLGVSHVGDGRGRFREAVPTPGRQRQHREEVQAWLAGGRVGPKPELPGAVPIVQVRNPRRWALLQGLPLWATMSVYLRTALEPWEEGELGPTPGFLARTAQVATGTRVVAPPTLDEINSRLERKLEARLNEAAERLGYIRRARALREGDPSAEEAGAK